MKKSLLLTLAAISLLSVSCATTGTAASTAGTSSTPQAQENNMIIPDSGNVKILGRTFTKNNVLYLTQSASAIEFTATAKELTINLAGDATARATRGTPPVNLARYSLYVNGELIETGSMDAQKKALKVFAGEETRTASIRLVKITESEQSILGIKSIVTDTEGSIAPAAEKSLKVEIIGDSITCGYGVEAENQNCSFTTQTENAEKSYSYLTVKALDADYSIVSYSGFGIYSGWSGDGQRNTISLVPPVYENICFTWGNAAYNGQKWDFSKFQPQLIVINLGTNDASYCKTQELKQKYIDSYVDFLKMVRKDNPKAYIVVSLGIMGDELFPSAQSAAEKYTELTGDSRISTFHFRVQNGNADGLGADWHPSAKTQASRAADLTAYLQSLIDSGAIN